MSAITRPQVRVCDVGEVVACAEHGAAAGEDGAQPGAAARRRTPQVPFHDPPALGGAALLTIFAGCQGGRNG
ncbi:MAG: hypothetical protein ACM3ML_23425 [Micromonosporaceae bacterium]